MNSNRESTLERLFTAKRVALVGASSSPVKWGSIILANIRLGNFKGELARGLAGRFTKPLAGQQLQ